jgi:hypothetical protein
MLLPEAPVFDHALAFLAFAKAHRRLPRRRAHLLNDRFYRLRVSAEMRSPLRRMFSDKELSKGHVAERVGARHVVPTLAILRSAQEVDAYAFPPDCCIKSTHASGHVMLRRNNAAVDRETIKRWTTIDYYRATREPNYRGLERKIIVEPIIFPGLDLIDYRFICVDGEPRLINIDGRSEGSQITAFVDSDWREIALLEKADTDSPLPQRPANFAEMLSIARRISAGTGLLRVDLYTDGTTILVGELTNCHAGGLRRFRHRQDEISLSAVLQG